MIFSSFSTSNASAVKSHRSIRVARPADLSFILHLQKVWSNNVGFLPKCSFERYIDNHQILLINENDDSAGYLSWTFRHDGIIRLPQLAIDPQLLRRSLGTRIMNRIAAAGRAGDCSIIRLRCRSNLTANTVWPTLGFVVTAAVARPTARGFPVLEWTKQLMPATEIAQLLSSGRRPSRIFRRRSKPHVVHDDLERDDV